VRVICICTLRRWGSSGPRVPYLRAFLRVSGSIGFSDRTDRPIFATADRSYGSSARGNAAPIGRVGATRAGFASISAGFGFIWFLQRWDRSHAGKTQSISGARPALSIALAPRMFTEIGGSPATKSGV
jgi:hypothetical protein